MKRIVIFTFILLGAVVSLSACSKEPEKTVITATLIPSPTPVAITVTPVPEAEANKENSEIKNEKISDEQEAVAAIFFDNLIGEFLGLPYETTYYNVEVGDKFEIAGEDCYLITVLDPNDGTEINKFYVSLSGEFVYGYDEANAGYYLVYSEEDVFADDDDDDADEDSNAAIEVLRSHEASALGLPSSFDMATCAIEFDGYQQVNGVDYFSFFISKDESFSTYYEYYVATDYTSLLIFDENNNQYYDLYTGEYVTEE